MTKNTLRIVNRIDRTSKGKSEVGRTGLFHRHDGRAASGWTLWVRQGLNGFCVTPNLQHKKGHLPTCTLTS